MNVPYRRAWAEERAPGDPLNTDQRQVQICLTSREAVYNPHGGHPHRLRPRLNPGLGWAGGFGLVGPRYITSFIYRYVVVATGAMSPRKHPRLQRRNTKTREAKSLPLSEPIRAYLISITFCDTNPFRRDFSTPGSTPASRPRGSRGESAMGAIRP